MNLERFLANKGVPRLIFCTGAGLSKESGIATFRDAAGEGLWDEVSVDTVCNIATFDINYHLIHNFYNKMRTGLKDYEPNAGHYFIAEMQQKYGDDLVMHITANVDDLVERAGGSAMHVHGFLTEVVEPYSTNSQDYTVRDIGYENFTPTPGVISKPNIVMFGENFWFQNGVRKNIYDDLYKVLDNITHRDTIIVIGSSDTVIPWSVYAGLATPAEVMNVNPEKHDNDDYFTTNVYSSITESLDTIEEFISERMDHKVFSDEEY